MRRFPRLLQVLGVNSVPVAGVFATDWTEATALALYWCENLMVTVLVGQRGPRGLFLVFAGLKTLADIGAFIGVDRFPDPEPAPWMVGLIRKVAGARQAEDFAEFHRRHAEEERRRSSRWEEVSSPNGDSDGPE